MLVGVVWNCAAELKLFLTALLFFCSLATVLHFLPSRFSSDDLRRCIDATTTITNNNISNQTSPPPTPTSPRPTPPPPPPQPPPPNKQQQKLLRREQILPNGIIKRAFNPYGSAAYNFILMSAYRGGLNTFAINALASKPLHVFGNPTYECRWVPHDPLQLPISTPAHKILPDWGYGRVYTVVVVNCTFPTPLIGGDAGGGKLLLLATTNGGGDRDFNTTDTIEALSEDDRDFKEFSANYLASKPKYDCLYCGSSLYGNLSPQRVREWLAYHVRLFGEKSHFVIHGAGGVHEGVMQVLRPWMEKGYVTLQDMRDQERFDGYYHNQFLVVNDCLHRYRFMARWIFFYDVDEFIFVPKKRTIKSVLDSLSGFTQFTIQQMPMSNKLCLLEDARKAYRKWGFEKLVYRDVKRGIRRDRKYAVQPRNVLATGVHMSENTLGKTTHKTEGRIKYFHYHGTIALRREPCRQLLNATAVTVDKTPYVLDTTMRDIAGYVKRFESKTIGSILQRTQQ